jgi:DNA-binding transcriptional LysR family regulator
MHYDFTDLRLLTALVDAGGIAATARRVNLSISAVSERVKALEERTGITLFTRTARGSLPTSAGRELAAYARAILRQAERFDGVVAAMKGRSGGKLKLLTNSNAIVSFLPDTLARFLAQNPDVALDVVELPSSEIARAIRAGEGDLGIAAGVVDMRELEIIPFRLDRIVLLVPAGHTLEGRKSISLGEVLDEGFIGLDDHAAIQVTLKEEAEKLGRSLVVRAKLRSFDGVCKMVAAGAGVAIVPESVVQSADVRVVPLSDSWARRDLVICLPRTTPRSDVLERLLDALQARAA